MGETGLGFLEAGSEARSIPYMKMRCGGEELVSPKGKDKVHERPAGQIKGINADKEKDEKDEQEEEGRRSSPSSHRNEEEQGLGQAVATERFNDEEAEAFDQMCSERPIGGKRGVHEEEDEGQECRSRGENKEAEGEDEDGRDTRGLPGPVTVSEAEREAHYRTHMPFQPWCRFCVRARAHKMQHRRKTEKEKEEEAASTVPRISMD